MAKVTCDQRGIIFRDLAVHSNTRIWQPGRCCNIRPPGPHRGAVPALWLWRGKGAGGKSGAPDKISPLLWAELEATRRGLVSTGLWFEILSAPQVEAVDLLCRSNSLASSPCLSPLPPLRSCQIRGDTEARSSRLSGATSITCLRTNSLISHVSI